MLKEQVWDWWFLIVSGIDGGHISVSSEWGEGSTFKIELPVELANTTDVAMDENCKSVKSLAPNQPTWRLLVVDDNANNRLLLSSCWRIWVFKSVKLKTDGGNLYIWSVATPFNLMDMRMPDMDVMKRPRKSANSKVQYRENHCFDRECVQRQHQKSLIRAVIPYTQTVSYSRNFCRADKISRC